LVEVFPPDSSDQSLYERMRQWNVRHRRDFLDLENTQIGLPLMELIQRIMIGAEILRQCLRVNGPAEYPTQGHAVHNTAVNGKANDPSGELIHHDQDPIGT